MNDDILHTANKLQEEINTLDEFIENICGLTGANKYSGITIKLTGKRWYGIGTKTTEIEIPDSMYEEIKSLSNKKLADLKKQYELLS